MCLLHTHPADTAFDEADIADFYKHNPDGVGVMWAGDGVMYVQKALPKTGAEAWQFYQTYIQGKECFVHWRMKTHGLIDLINCHPYEIFGDGSAMPMYIMHNGILATGNAADKSKSDTWHYVEDFLKPLLKDHPDMFNNPVITLFIEEHIGHGNRFIILNHLGEASIVNERDFVDYKGAKLSNTYAWSSEKGGYGMSRYAGYAGYIPNYAYSTSNAGASSTKKWETSWAQKLRNGSSSFFSMLKKQKHEEAWDELNFTEVEDAIEDVGELLWGDFVNLILANELTDELIIDCVRDPDVTMIEVLYGTGSFEDEVVDAVATTELVVQPPVDYEYDEGCEGSNHLRVGLM